MAGLYPPLRLAFRYHAAMPRRIREYLNGRGISDRMIEEHVLGWNGERITFPIFNREGKLAFFKLAKDPEDQEGPKMVIPLGGSAELYGWEHVDEKSWQVVICEGEFDRLVLEDHYIPAVTSTGGAGVFRPQWAEALAAIREVFICFDRDEAGKRGALRVARLVRHTKIIELLEEVGEGGDVTDFFVRLGHTREEFLHLMQAAQRPSFDERSGADHQSFQNRSNANDEVARLKSLVRIEDVIKRFLPLRPSGQNYAAQCPFHEDHVPSFVVFPQTQSFYCFGCQVHGDVLSFLMRLKGLMFPEALKVLQELSSP